MKLNKRKLIDNFRKIFKNETASYAHVLLSPGDGDVDIDKVLGFLGEKITDPMYTEDIGRIFEDILPLVLKDSVNYTANIDAESLLCHRRKCIALAKLLTISPHAQRFALTYFDKMPAPFFGDQTNSSISKKKKMAKTTATNDDAEPTKLDILKCCYNFLKFNTTFFMQQWKWEDLIKNYGDIDKQSDEYKLIFNHILALLTNMTQAQLEKLNENIPVDVQIDFVSKQMPSQRSNIESIGNFGDSESIEWNLKNDLVFDIEGVLLPIFDATNASLSANCGNIVMVESARSNLKSIAIGVAAGKAVCLSGSVGSGKTTLIEYLANRTGRIPPKQYDVSETDDSNKNSNAVVADESKKSKSSKRKAVELDKAVDNPVTVERKSQKNGFLRIQLGDQTDSKMLLGQYHCTDVPGEFVWQPGVLTQAVMNGYWLLLEDLDQCSQDVCVMLTNFFENNYLSVPGFRDCIQISPGFQLFVTRRSNERGMQSRTSNLSYFQLLEKYLYTINMLPLTRTELCEIVCEKYPKLTTVADRIVDVFSMFSFDAAKGFVESGVKDSGRLVSTRDLLKLCSRSSPTFSITSTECAYFVFQNAVDLFCSHLAQGDGKNGLIVDIGSRLGIIPSRCDYLSNEYKPDVSIDDGARSIRVGRITLTRRTGDNSSSLKRTSNSNVDEVDGCSSQKRVRIDADAHLSVFQQQVKQKTPHFSFTRLASCLLERIAVAVQENEPVLLVGETGVGKTSSVQYLAHQTNHKLVVVNMNNQSDVSDLIGGFKPVDLAFVMAPLRAEFEFLFRKTIDVTKNEKLLNNISVCYNQGNFSILIQLMLRLVEKVFGHLKTKTGSAKIHENLTRWTTLNTKLKKLNKQLEQSMNISFAFIAGPLVNCIKNGDWVLLDEINLASPETLECLSTILEANGSIVLLEKGDFVPVKRHPDFRIFACMNPSTDVGKKDLTTGIRNRFTEFFVDELTLESDQIILVSDYLRNTGIHGAKVLAIVQLYRKLRAMAQLELNDGLGNRPVYSLRTLCRALVICAKNLCGSIERNLYESFCLSFLTQLDPVSHAVVLNLIQKSLIPKNEKAVLSQGLPKPKENVDYTNFEGYWIKLGPKSVQLCENYIITESVRENLRDLARIISIGQLPVLLQGPTSAGKTSLIDYVAKRSGNYCLRINNHEHTDLQEYIGTYTADVTGKLVFQEGVLVQAMKNGYWIILDELNLAPSDILEALNRVLDDNRELFIPETQELVRAHPNFMLFATQNPPGLYGGRKMLSRAFKNRFVELHFSEIPKHELEIILEKRCLIPKSYAQKMVKTMSELQVNRTNTAKCTFTLRDLFRWGNRYTFANKELLNNSKYDWNQHLVDEGYLVLSSRVRNDIEVQVIENALFTNFRKKIVVENLFNLHDDTSMVTRSILQNVFKYTGATNVVWTSNMLRMAVLTGKALEFNEPVLLVGQTGCGKTTICQILSYIVEKRLRILNCHMHTEGADFLGGLRPYRGNDTDDEMEVENASNQQQRKLFQWNDGPLIQAMTEGTFFLADEISLAEDSVLERLNCVLEPERTILLAEKGGCSENILNDLTNSDESDGEFVIKATDGFQFLATMNPSGDFGKKELSPALRNRFTEIWCRSADNEVDLTLIAQHALTTGFDTSISDTVIKNVALVIVKTVRFIKANVEKFHYSVRDILAWVQFVTINSKNLPIHQATLFGLETMFLDSLEMLPHIDFNEIVTQRNTILAFIVNEIQHRMEIAFGLQDFALLKGDEVKETSSKFGISPFYIDVNTDDVSSKTRDFKFTAPTTKNNLFRLLSAMSLHKAILLEGPPGVGKTSLIENVASAIGYKMVRINLCEHTDLTDLFGTDQPSDESGSSLANGTSDQEPATLGAFVWRDGPLLAALKAPNTWILLDELNLAPQSVLEGLNAILDHRGEVYVPELNKTFKLDKQTRIFASQNPLRQGGGRKGLPQSFLNRFTKVYLRTLNSFDLCHIIEAKYGKYFDELKHFLLPSLHSTDDTNPASYFDSIETALKFDLCERMVKFSERLDEGINNLEFGYKGGPYEVNLRDILRWCELLSSESSGFSVNIDSTAMNSERYNNFMLTLYEKMQLVYCQRMRTDTDKLFIRNIFGDVFHCDADALEKRSNDICLYWNDEFVHFNDVRISRINQQTTVSGVTKKIAPLVLNSQRQLIKAIGESILMETPVILCGPNDSGKTKLVDTLCKLSNRQCNIDTIDDSVTGSFQQVDLNRHLEEIAQKIETHLVRHQQNWLLTKHKPNSSHFIKLLKEWESFVESSHSYQNDNQSETVMSEELQIFKRRVAELSVLLKSLLALDFDAETKNELEMSQQKLKILSATIENRGTLNTGGHFEWVDSKIVQALKTGQYICLEHVNLCSSAILDRLNSVFETDGKLLLSEKGVESNNQSESVSKHSEFRAFLTLDPRNGEISRAMRNRCIELSLMADTYSRDDLKELIYLNGIHEMHLIEWTLNVHCRVQGVSEFNTFNVSHLTKFAFLINENLRLGADEPKALYDSALVVYVRSSHIDLLGMGLHFYHEKLIEEIRDEINRIPDKNQNIVNLANLIITSDNLNSLTLIRLQCEPLITAVQCLASEMSEHEIQTVFGAIREKFSTLPIDLNWKSVEYHLHMIYEMSSLNDLTAREQYIHINIQKLFTKSNECHRVHLNKLLDLNHALAEAVRQSIPNNLKKSPSSSLVSVPWNQHILPRLRDYSNGVPLLSKIDQLKLSAILMANLSFDAIEIDTAKVKQSLINAITYSKAVNAGTIPNGLDIDLVTHLYPLLDYIRHFTTEIIWQAQSINYQQYSAIICAYLWANRLYEVSKNKIFKDKSVDKILIDKLALHFNWLMKHLFNVLNGLAPAKSAGQTKEITQFRRTVQKICECTTVRRHPLNEMRKLFTKKLAEFKPFYEQNQITLHEFEQEFSKQSTKNWQSLEPAEYVQSIINKYRIMLSDESAKYKHYLVDNADADGLHWLAADCNDNVDDLQHFDESKIVDKLEQLTKSSTLFGNQELSAAMVSLDDLNEENTKFAQYLEQHSADQKHSDIAPLKLIVSVLPFTEYFALRALNAVLQRNANVYGLNVDFFKNIRSLDVTTLKSMRTVASKDFKIAELIWNWVREKINAGESIESILAVMPPSVYKKISSTFKTLDSRVLRFGYNSLALHHELDSIDTPQRHKFQSLNSCVLTVAVFLSLSNEFGKSKSIGLGNLEVWSSTLTSLSKLLWNNVEIFQNKFEYEQTGFEHSLNYGRRLSAEVKYIQALIERSDSQQSQTQTDFLQLIELLEKKIQGTPATNRFDKFYASALIQTLAAVIELHLMNFTPLVDPVEKNRLKKSYVQENQNHLTNLTSAYDFMKVIMSYDGLGEQIVEALGTKNGDQKILLEKYSEKCALRPEACVYAELVDQINFFLENGCRPKSLFQLIIDIDSALERVMPERGSGSAVTQQDIQNIDEIIKRVDWCTNTAESFERSTIVRFGTYYRDFTAPLESSVIMLKSGLRGLKQCLVNKKETTINRSDGLSQALANLVEFPSAEKTIKSVSIDGISGRAVHDKDLVRSRLLKSVLQETSCSLSLSGTIDRDTFHQMEEAICSFYKMWEQQEEIKRAKSIEEESLYVKKTRCVDENEDEITDQDVETLFPNYATTDFGEFIQNPTLEAQKEPVKKPQPTPGLLEDEDLKFFGDVFIDTMFKYSRCDYHKPSKVEFNSSAYRSELVDAYELKSNVFFQIVREHKHSLSSEIDDTFYGGIGLLINATQNKYRTQSQTNSDRVKLYNFYKDSNIPEVYNTTGLLDRIEVRVLNELNQWPDHAVLNDIILIIGRIRSLDITEPIARFNTGFQILRQKVDEWNSVSHKLNHLRDLETEIAEHVQRWMKLELQCWRECLATTSEKVKSKAYRYWFFMYNLLHEYLAVPIKTFACDLTDFKAVEKYFGEGDIDLDAENVEQNTQKLRTSDVISVLKQFIESSNYGEFELRMQILKSFELYLQQLDWKNFNKKRDRMISIMHNLHTYYSQFAGQIAETIKSKQTQIEKKLKEFVKIESYNKDLSYFGMKNNVARVHRHLFKFLREFETALMEKIAQVFVWKANETYPLNDEPSAKGSTNAYTPNIASYSIDVKHFISSHSPKTESISTSDESLLAKIDKLFGVSRNVVKNAILHAEFPSLLYNLDMELAAQIETCSYLRGLEVDRTQEKPKQKSQAKHILTQKRKAVADSFKLLTKLGLSFRSGLLESSMQSDLVDLKLSPFCIQNVIDASTHGKINQSLSQLTRNIDLNFSKCVFKLKLLQTVLLTPNAELGLPNMERVKGFTADMFLLAQLQRQTLSKSTVELQRLQENIKHINELQEILSNEDKDFEFEAKTSKLSSIERKLICIIDMTEQYELLLDGVPTEEDKTFTAIESGNVSAFTKSSEKYRKTKLSLTSIAQTSKALLNQVQSTKNCHFLNSKTMGQISTHFDGIVSELKCLSKTLQLNDNEYLPFAKSLVKLLQRFENESDRTIFDGHSQQNHSHQNISNELENVVHHILLSMQNIYKKYSVQKPTEATESIGKEEENQNGNEHDDDQEEETIQEKHLKQKITAEINTDWQTLGLSTVSSKLSTISRDIYYTKNDQSNDRTECVRKLVSILPILEQFELLCKYYLVQQLGAHKVSTKMLSVMLTVFIELTAKGFCIPPDLMQDEDGQQNENGDGKEGEGFGLEDGTGEKDVSDKIESEDQLDTAKKPGDRDEDKKEDGDCEETNGIDMSEDFDSKLQDIEKRGDDSSDDNESDNEELDKEMGETEQGAEKLDDQIWGSDEEEDEEENEGDDKMDEETDANGSKDDKENHNNLDSEQNEQGQGEDQDGLDATNEEGKKEKKKDQIDKMNEDETGEEQVNPYHNELEEPPEPEDMDLGDVNLDNQDNNDNNDEQNEENPFDIDSMKENLEADANDDEEQEDGESGENDDKDQADMSDNSDVEDEDGLKKDNEPEKQDNQAGDGEEEQPGDKDPNTQEPGLDNEDAEDKPEDENETKDEEKENNKNEKFQESIDKPSNEDNVQAMPDNMQQGSTDQVEAETQEKNKQEDTMDAQDTGEEQNGIGQAANEESKSGHQGVSDAKNTQKTEESEKNEQKDRKKPGATNDDRTISENKHSEKKQLKTVQEIDQAGQKDEPNAQNDVDEKNSEYQHIKDAKETENTTTTMDNATEEQSKKVKNDDEAEESAEPDFETNDELMEQETSADEPMENVPEIDQEKLNESNKNNKKGSNNDRQNEACEAKEECNVDGEIVTTHTVLRPGDTTAHCSVEIIRDSSVAQELDNSELLDIRKMYEKERTSTKLSNPDRENFEVWQTISNKMLPNARELCEQLRLILEPTKCTRLKGDYRTGRRINMKKIIPYIASQFRKDKIWLRRTKPAQRDYKITIAIDDSKSMDYNNSKELTLQAISLVSQALTLLESGRLSIMSFGEAPKIILNHTDQFDGPTLVNSLNFAQNQSRIAELMEFIRVACNEDTGASSDNGIFENLLLVLSDGRNIYSEGEKKVRNAIKLARLNRIFVVYIIIDNPENKHSILDIRVPHFSGDRKTITMKSYLDTFPFPYYVIVRDLTQLPLVLSDAMRQWFELVSSEQ